MIYIIKFITGVVGLGIIVLIHELGHLLAARATHIGVKVFSIGFGPKLISWKPKNTEYRLSLLPLGGYCRMEGSDLLLEKNRKDIPVNPHSFHHATPVKKIIILLAGPFANVVAAYIGFLLIGFIGMPIETYGNKIVLASDLQPSETIFPSEAAGLKTGDAILRINGIPIHTFYDIQTIVSRSPHIPLRMTVMRDGIDRDITITPAEEDFLGEGQIGVYPWLEPIIASVEEGSPAAAAGLLPGDVIATVRDLPLSHALELNELLHQKTTTAPLEVLRNSERIWINLVPPQGENSHVGIQFPTHPIMHREKNPPIVAFTKIKDILRLTLKGIGYIATEGKITEVIAGPIQITFFTGEAATGRGGFDLLNFINFLAILSIAVAFMNLLPIPVTDGGQIILPLIELLRGKPLSFRVHYWYHLTGIGIIVIIFAFALLGDISFLRGLK